MKASLGHSSEGDFEDRRSHRFSINKFECREFTFVPQALMWLI